MGYTTQFEGSFDIVPPLHDSLVKEINKFSEDDHRDHENLPPVRKGSYYCQWIVSQDGSRLFWDGGEKFYNYEDWLEYLMRTFLRPHGHKLEGSIRFRGEDFDDYGKLEIDNNVNPPLVRKTFL